MRLTDHTDYALRVLMYVGAQSGRLVTIKEIADNHGISRNHLMKIVHRLGVAGLVATVRGRTGGIRLARKADEVTVGEVVRLTEPDFNMVECFDESTNMCSLSPICELKHGLARATKAYLQELDRIPLASVLPLPLSRRTVIPLQGPISLT